MIVPIRIPRRSRQCHCCSFPFGSETEYISVLSEEKKEGEYLRVDYCCKCWESQRSDQLLTYWKGRVPPKRMFSEDPEEHYLEVFDFLKDEMQKNTKEAEEVAFLLSLYLLRKKKIAFRQEFEHGNGTYQIYEVLSTEEMLTIKKQTLSEERVFAIQQEFTERFVPSFK